MMIFKLVFNLALLLAAASFLLPIVFSLIGMFLPFIGMSIVILVVAALVFK